MMIIIVTLCVFRAFYNIQLQKFCLKILGNNNSDNVQFAHAWQSLVDTSQAVGGAGVVNISSRHPVGVAGLISPWNLPLYLLTFKVQGRSVKLFTVYIIEIEE